LGKNSQDLHLALDPPQVYIGKAKGGSDGYVPILPALAQELRTHLGSRRNGYVFESKRNRRQQRLPCCPQQDRIAVDDANSAMMPRRSSSAVNCAPN
jgi:integrase